MINSSIELILNSRALSRDEFIKKFGNDLIYNDLHNSKCGLIEITHNDTNEKHHGFTAAFGENLSCFMSNEYEWYTTSVIKNIDWDNNKFKTLNSVYRFKFKEIDCDKLLKEIREYESKNKEIE